MSLEVRACTGDAIVALIPQLAALRVEIFADFPYLYDGDLDYEARYLDLYASHEGSVVIVAEEADEIVGASTGIPFVHEPESMREPFVKHGWDPSELFYGGESILRATHRGRGVYSRFHAMREAHARSLGATWLTFCAVQRADDHPERPQGYVPLDDVWRHFGYAPREELNATMRWKDRGDAEESDHPMRFWVKRLVAG